MLSRTLPPPLRVLLLLSVAGAAAPALAEDLAADAVAASAEGAAPARNPLIGTTLSTTTLGPLSAYHVYDQAELSRALPGLRVKSEPLRIGKSDHPAWGVYLGQRKLLTLLRDSVGRISSGRVHFPDMDTGRARLGDPFEKIAAAKPECTVGDEQGQAAACVLGERLSVRYLFAAPDLKPRKDTTRAQPSDLAKLAGRPIIGVHWYPLLREPPGMSAASPGSAPHRAFARDFVTWEQLGVLRLGLTVKEVRERLADERENPDGDPAERSAPVTVQGQPAIEWSYPDPGVRVTFSVVGGKEDRVIGVRQRGKGGFSTMLGVSVGDKEAKAQAAYGRFRNVRSSSTTALEIGEGAYQLVLRYGAQREVEEILLGANR